MKKKTLRKSSFNKATKTVLIIAFLALILIFLYLIVPPILQLNHKGFIFGNNLPVTSLNNIVVVIDLADMEDGNVSATLSAILIPAKSQCIKRIIFDVPAFSLTSLLAINPEDKNYLYDFEKITEQIPLELDPSLQQPYYLLPQGTPRIILPPLNNKGFVFTNAICAAEVSRVVEYDEIKQYLPKSVEPSIVINTKENDFYYPFDKRSLDFSIWVVTDDSDNLVPSDIIGTIYSREWDKYPSIKTHPIGFTSLEVEYLRPIFIRYLVVVLLLLLFSSIVASAFIKDDSNYIEVMLGALLGLNGLHPVLKPIELVGNKMIDFLFIGFYILIGISFFTHFVIMPLWHFTDKMNLTNLRRTGKNKKNRNSS